MRVKILPNKHQAVAATVDLLTDRIARQPDAVLGLATGGTMEGVYRGLIAAYESGAVTFRQASSFNLDEYVGLGPDHPQSYHHYMADRFFRHVDFPAAANHLPQGDHSDPDAAAKAYEALIAQRAPIDLQLLGLGQNGHIGFNEPGSPLESRSRVTSLAASTIEANSRFFGAGETQPRSAITMGIGTICDARRIVLLATGNDKAAAAAAMIEGPVTTACPASALQTHPDTTIVLDAAAAALLSPKVGA
ncbi:glucosamine-6-phosphate deaminase [Falsirhodobacter sp. alg1]|uniref:glucosamine-6-phosphate deaminase n=1 Tax=Falsirhodobacter sp. alg1 TaxID=1472418 RepID=UPI0005F09D97|nr:glucosamine-6-phosphate deaminase [Falsirhodobacter sp. alg1]